MALAKRYWRSSEKRLLVELYPDVSAKVIAERLGRSCKSVRSMAFIFGLKKSEKFMSVDRHEFTRAYHADRKERNMIETEENNDTTGTQLTKNWTCKCDICESLPTVADSGLCGPCFFGETDTIDGNW